MNDRFPEAFLDELRAAVAITDVVGQHVQWDKGQGTGDVRWACCPLHGESTPSFKADDREGYWKCHGCGEGGDQFQFLIKHLGIEFPEAVAQVAALGGIALPENAQGEPKPARPPEQPRQTKTPPQPSAAEVRPQIVRTYDYTDRDGNLLYQVCRLQKKMPDGTWARTKDGKGTWKNFLQRRPDGAGKWIWSLAPGEFMRRPGGDWRPFNAKAFMDGMETRFFDAGAEHTIYQHPAVEVAIAEGRVILLTEGEKDADTAAHLGFCGTTNSSGSKHWTDTHAACFRDADVVICLDNDEAGDRADKLAKSLKGIARRIRVLNFADHVPGFDHKGDITDWVDKFGGNAEQLQAILDELPDYRPHPPAGFGARSMLSLAGKPIEYDWLIKGLVERNGVFILAAEKQAGKSFVVMDMGMKIARGLQYGDRITRKGIVIHIACEDGKGVQMRAEGYRQANKISPDTDIPYIIMDREFTLMIDEVIDKLVAQVKAWEDYYGMPVELIIIDTLSVATEGLNEIDGAEVGKVLARVNRLKDETGAAICLVHHMNASGGRVRGHTSIEANVSQVFEIRPLMTMPQNRKESPQPVLDGEGRHIRQIVLTKNKNGINNLKWKIVLEVVKLGIDSDGDEITTCICTRPARHSNTDMPEDQTKLVGDQKLVFDALIAAQADSTLSGPGSGNKAVNHTDFMTAVRKRMSFKAPEEEQEARQTELAAYLKRTTTALINAGYMGRDNDKRIVWWTGKSDRPRSPRQEMERPPEQPGAGIADDVRKDLSNDPVPF
ncbi:AAA family ATPase [Devosia sp. FJ2-5-3]|uniref:AAA family ATPase n=1 Tax=Devosia sp. FJ2-5-3 TaxID=2976680 RepID=UPI0023D7F783|nr:AAA family ATPase [Devosia sp. FJ2-5-3]WEJ60213.1 AAA family ATPase [Devosia sp. FJ2-5-3]